MFRYRVTMVARSWASSATVLGPVHGLSGLVRHADDRFVGFLGLVRHADDWFVVLVGLVRHADDRFVVL